MYRRTDSEPVFVEVPAPKDEALRALLHKIIGRLMKLLIRRGALVQEGSGYLADGDANSDDACALRPLHAAACSYRIAFGRRAGQKLLTVQGTMPRDAEFTPTLFAYVQGFSMHAAVRCAGDERQRLEQLCCRYLARPALANEREKSIRLVIRDPRKRRCSTQAPPRESLPNRPTRQARTCQRLHRRGSGNLRPVPQHYQLVPHHERKPLATLTSIA